MPSRFRHARPSFTGFAKTLPAVAGVIGLTVVAGLSSGCYERVVKARGFGAGSVDVAKPNLTKPGDEDNSNWKSSGSVNWPTGRTKASGW